MFVCSYCQYIDPETLTKCKQLVPVLKNLFTNIENREVTVFFLSWTSRTSGHKIKFYKIEIYNIEYHKITTHVFHLVEKFVKKYFRFVIRSCDIRPSDPQSLQRQMNILIIDTICRLHRKSLSRCNIPSYHLLKGIIQF